MMIFTFTALRILTFGLGRDHLLLYELNQAFLSDADPSPSLSDPGRKTRSVPRGSGVSRPAGRRAGPHSCGHPPPWTPASAEQASASEAAVGKHGGECDLRRTWVRRRPCPWASGPLSSSRGCGGQRPTRSVSHAYWCTPTQNPWRGRNMWAP